MDRTSARSRPNFTAWTELNAVCCAQLRDGAVPPHRDAADTTPDSERTSPDELDISVPIPPADLESGSASLIGVTAATDWTFDADPGAQPVMLVDAWAEADVTGDEPALAAAVAACAAVADAPEPDVDKVIEIPLQLSLFDDVVVVPAVLSGPSRTTARPLPARSLHAVA